MGDSDRHSSNSGVICALCTCSLNPDQHLSSLPFRFITELASFCDNKNYGNLKVDAIHQAQKQEPFDGTSSVCENCEVLVETALTAKDSVVKMEVGVRKLEAKLLRDLKELKQQLETFLAQVMKIEEILGKVTLSSRKGCQGNLSGYIQRLVNEVTQTLRKDCYNFLPNANVNKRFKSTFPDSAPNSSLKENSYLEQGLDGVKQEIVTSDGDGYAEEVMDKDAADYNNESDNASLISDADSGSEEDDSEEEDSAASSSELSEGDEPSKKKSSSRARAKINESCNLSVNIRRMPRFKQGVIRRTLENRLGRAFRPRSTKQSPDNVVRDPRRDFRLDYDESKDQLSICNIEIQIEESSSSLVCGECGFKAEVKSEIKESQIDRIIFNHVVIKHLHVFRCPLCGEDRSTIAGYRYHMNTHKNGYHCDICGKPLARPGAIRTHKWTHLSPDEKAEAIKNGQTPPMERASTKKGKFQCATCGKICSTPYVLRNHEDNAHGTKTLEEKKPIICPNCGKRYSEYKFKYAHSKICHPPGEEPAPLVKCIQCPKFFKSVSLMQGHFKRNHTEKGKEKNCVCVVCSKAFRTNTSLKNHWGHAHSDEKPFSCEKGCGTTFKSRSSLKRHGKVCDGRGTKPGRKGNREQQRFLHM